MNWLVNPPTGIHDFDPRFIDIHGITPTDVRRTGIAWEESLQRILMIADDLPFVAHNAGFDKSVYHRASERVGISVPPSHWFDTLDLARRHIVAPDHKLPTVASALGLPDFSHHQAEADAITSARIALAISDREQIYTVQDLWSAPTFTNGTPSPQRRQSARPKFSRVSDLPKPNDQAHKAHPFFGQHVVITGDLDDFSRDEFFMKVAECGGQPQLHVTKKTTMLVVATHQVIDDHYDHSNGRGKERKAAEYNAAGQNIAFIGANLAVDYLTMTTSDINIQPIDTANPDKAETQLDETPPVVESHPVEPVPGTRPSGTLPSQDHTNDTARKAHTRLKTRKHSSLLDSNLVKTLAWALAVLSGLLVALWLVGSTATFVSADYPDTTFFTWIIGLIFGVAVLSMPGVLGFFLLRRQKQRRQPELNA